MTKNQRKITLQALYSAFYHIHCICQVACRISRAAAG